jgi:N6-adenosine-specific RNA methylase IME4
MSKPKQTSTCGHLLYPSCGCATLAKVIDAAAARFDARPIERASIETRRELDDDPILEANRRAHAELAALRATKDGPSFLERHAPPTPPPFRVIVADPAWRFKDALPGPKRGAAKHYDVMTNADICRLVHGENFPPIADDAHLFLWRVSSMPQEALDVIKAWGFTVKSELVWIKKTKNGLPHFGMGRHTRLGHEICHIATRGKGAGIKNRSQRSVFYTDAPEDVDKQLGHYDQTDDDGGGSFEATVGRHSEKPPEFFRIVEDLCESDLRVELFARSARSGWVTVGNQVPGDSKTMGVA